MPQLDKTYWNDRWQAGQTGWDAGGITAPLKAYIDQLTNKDEPILIPGCGNAWEAVYLLQQGFTRLTVLDISPLAIQKVQEKAAAYGKLQAVCDDFFTHTGVYDRVLEQTFFCALDPRLRPSYVNKMGKLLRPGGTLAGVLFASGFTEPGPPFGGTAEEYRELFSPLFNIRTLAPCYNSIPPRAGNELFLIAAKRE